MNNRDKSQRKFCKSKDNKDWEDNKHLRNSCTTQIRKARSDYHQNLLMENRNNLQQQFSLRRKALLNQMRPYHQYQAVMSGIKTHQIRTLFASFLQQSLLISKSFHFHFETLFESHQKSSSRLRIATWFEEKENLRLCCLELRRNFRN